MKTDARVKKTFSGEKALEKFCLWLFQNSHKDSIAIAHNMKGLFYIICLICIICFISGYDGQFLLQWINKQCREPKVITRGMEILSLEYNNVKVRDSYNFLTMALSAMPKALGFDAVKGYFPHLFNTNENWNVVQQGLPDAW